MEGLKKKINCHQIKEMFKNVFMRKYIRPSLLNIENMMMPINACIVQFLFNAMLGSIGMDLVISEWYYKGTILQRNYNKWSFSYNFFIKFHVKIIWEPQHDWVISKSVL